jgi:hypothetical protein
MNPLRKAAAGAALLAATLAGGAIGASMLGTASAQTDPSTSTTDPSAGTVTPPAADPDVPHDPSKGGHTANGITEALLTGDTAAKVTAAAQKAVPGATIERVETDAEGAAYEAHMVKADGTHVIVTFNDDFSVAAIEDHPGR